MLRCGVLLKVSKERQFLVGARGVHFQSIAKRGCSTRLIVIGPPRNCFFSKLCAAGIPSAHSTSSGKSKAIQTFPDYSRFMSRRLLPFLRFSPCRSSPSVAPSSIFHQRYFTSTPFRMADLAIDLTAPNGKKFTLPTGIFINNEFVKPKSGEKITSINPTLVTSRPTWRHHHSN